MENTTPDATQEPLFTEPPEILMGPKDDELKRYASWVSGMLSMTGDDGRIDTQIIMKNIVANVSVNYSKLSNLLFQEKRKLNDMEYNLRKHRKNKIIALKKEVKATLMSREWEDVVSGEPEVNVTVRESEKQRMYVEQIEKDVQRLTFYHNTVNTLLETKDLEAKYGGFG